MNDGKRLLALLLALLLVFALVGCGDRGVEEESVSEESSDVEVPDDTVRISTIMSDYLELVAEKKSENEDTIGWLQIPYTAIDDVVLHNAENNSYYLRRDFYGAYNFNGVYYADRRSVLGDGTAGQIGNNICIYGHALTDDPESDNYEIKFGPLHDFRDAELAKDIPYIFFTTETENLVYEVCAVFIANSDNQDIPYNRGDMTQEEFYKMVTEQVLPRSIYNYDVEISETDKFLTLSTCIYKLPDGTPTGYPDTYYRFAIMAKLVDPQDELKTEASFTVNEDFLLDPDGKMAA